MWNNREIQRNSTAKPGNLNKLWKHWKRYAQTGYANECGIIEKFEEIQLQNQEI